ncbi:MAG: SAM-dependent methyltransferase [Oscillospiraceae bacterium]|jgi:adenine-specific DNA-methyltransferase|nr:SAM-dependent methyltransferase [Oscillospiraceae bacterium]
MSETKKKKIKTAGEVYTPAHIVSLMLDEIGYNGETVSQKHIIDNSCGDGAFLMQIVERYIKNCPSTNDIKNELETYIHGIEIDKTAYKNCIKNLDAVAEKHGITSVNWDVINEDTLKVSKYDGEMDFVVGNPPYIRVHNLNSNYKSVKKFEFANGGMTDIYIVFFEIGLRMMNGEGRMCLITPSSFYSSLAGKNLRKYIIENKNLNQIIDLGHYIPFENITTYTAITLFEMGKKFKQVLCYKLNEKGKQKIDAKNYDNLFINKNIVLGNNKENEWLSEIEWNYENARDHKISVKNGFATLADSVFMGDIDFEDDLIIDCFKASRAKWTKCIFPYMYPGKLLSLKDLKLGHPKTYNYLYERITRLTDRDIENRNDWFAFGRSQAINDVYKDKISINTIIRDVDSIKINNVPKGKGIYSGLYILSQHSVSDIETVLKTDDFIKYISLLKKYKSSGYYTFSSKDLEKYLVYKLKGDGYEQQRFSISN